MFKHFDIKDEVLGSRKARSNNDKFMMNEKLCMSQAKHYSKQRRHYKALTCVQSILGKMYTPNHALRQYQYFHFREQ